MNTSQFDPSMKKLVLLLNRIGLKTWGSCSGHPPRSQKHFYEEFGYQKDRNHSLTISKHIKRESFGTVYFKKPSHAKKFYLMIRKLVPLKFKSRIRMPTKIHIIFNCYGFSQKKINSFWKDVTKKFEEYEKELNKRDN